LQTILTFITRVDPAKLASLEGLLQEIQDSNPTGHHPALPLADLKRLHFGSMVIFKDPDGNYDPTLVFENNFDGELDDYLEDLLERAAAGLHQIYSHCLDYRATGSQDREEILAFLHAHIVRPNAYHIGNVGRGVARIKQEEEMMDGIEAFLDGFAREGLEDVSPSSVRNSIQQFVESKPEWAWARQAQKRMTFAERLIPWAKVIGVGLLVLILLPLLLPFLIIYVIALRGREITDRSEIPSPEQGHTQQLARREDHIVQNHMASLCYVKPGRFRRLTLRGVLWLANLVARISYKGKLSGLDSLHFAHWVLIDNGRRLLFLTNYDGSWENYLDDFIDKAALGLTGIWSNTMDFPRTSFLVFGGARDAARFKAIARRTQAYTNVWFSAYPELTVQGVDNNSTIREDLFRSLCETAKMNWLRRF
jgi:hypothetical protein